MDPLVLIVIAVIVVLVVLAIGIYNSLVQKRLRIDEAFAQIEVQLKRRWDLIPNLVDAVKGYMGFEQKVLTDVTEARANAVSAGAKGAHESAIAEKFDVRIEAGVFPVQPRTSGRDQLRTLPQTVAHGSTLGREIIQHILSIIVIDRCIINPIMDYCGTDRGKNGHRREGTRPQAAGGARGIRLKSTGSSGHY